MKTIVVFSILCMNMNSVLGFGNYGKKMAQKKAAKAQKKTQRKQTMNQGMQIATTLVAKKKQYQNPQVLLNEKQSLMNKFMQKINLFDVDERLIIKKHRGQKTYQQDPQFIRLQRQRQTLYKSKGITQYPSLLNYGHIQQQVKKQLKVQQQQEKKRAIQEQIDAKKRQQEYKALGIDTQSMNKRKQMTDQQLMNSKIGKMLFGRKRK